MGVVGPLVVAVVPLPTLFELGEFPLQAFDGNGLALGVDEECVEGDSVAFAGLQLSAAGCAEQRFDADAGTGGADRHGDGTFDGAAAGFAEADDDVGFQRAGGFVDLWERDGQGGDASCIGIGQAFELFAGGGYFFV